MMSVLYHPSKANVVTDALSRITMGSVSHLNEAKKDLATKVHKLARLGVRLESAPDGSVVVHHNSKLPLVVEVKSKQQLDLALMEFKESVLGKMNNLFSQGGMVFLGIKEDCVCLMVMI